MAKSYKNGAESVLERHELDSIDRRILELRMRYPAISDREIAEVVGLSRKQTNKRQHAAKFKAALEQFTQEPIDTIRASLKKAARVVARALESNDEKLRVATALKVLYSENVMKQKADETAREVEPLVIVTSKEEIVAGSKSTVEKALKNP